MEQIFVLRRFSTSVFIDEFLNVFSLHLLCFELALLKSLGFSPDTLIGVIIAAVIFQFLSDRRQTCSNVMIDSLEYVNLKPASRPYVIFEIDNICANVIKKASCM